MAQSIELMGATYNDVPSVIIPKSGGGAAKFIDQEAWNWVGIEPKLVDTIARRSFTLGDTDYDEWEASTTAKILFASENASTFVADMANKAYAIKWRWQIDVMHLEGITLKAVPIHECGEIWYTIFKRPNSIANIVSNNYNGNVAVNTRSPGLTDYYNSSGSHTYAFSTSYGFYASAVAPTFSNSTSSSPTVTVKTPSFSTRCSSSYFATSRKPYIDTDSPIMMECLLYEFPKRCVETLLHESLIDLYNNPLQSNE